MAGILYPRLKSGSRLFWRDLHAVTGIYVSTFALILLLSGLPWTSVWGAGFKAVVAATKPAAAKAEWSSGRAQETQQAKADAHAEHGHGTGGMGHDMGTDLTGVDGLLPAIRALDLPAPIIIKPDGHRQWQAGSATQNLTARSTVTFDADKGTIVKQTGFAEKAFMDKAVLTAISLHEGHLFGWLNQLIGLLTALGLLTLSVSSVVMWWSKRPADRLGAPPGLGGKPGPGLMLILVFTALFLPLMGASLILIAIIEFTILRRIASVRNWLGLDA